MISRIADSDTAVIVSTGSARLKTKFSMSPMFQTTWKSMSTMFSSPVSIRPSVVPGADVDRVFARHRVDLVGHHRPGREVETFGADRVALAEQQLDRLLRGVDPVEARRRPRPPPRASATSAMPPRPMPPAAAAAVAAVAAAAPAQRCRPSARAAAPGPCASDRRSRGSAGRPGRRWAGVRRPCRRPRRRRSRRGSAAAPGAAIVTGHQVHILSRLCRDMGRDLWPMSPVFNPSRHRSGRVPPKLCPSGCGSAVSSARFPRPSSDAPPRCRSKSALVAPILIATAASWIISPAPSATMWQPSTLSVAFDTISLNSTRSAEPMKLFCIGRNAAQ